MRIAVISPETFVPRLQSIAPEFETIAEAYGEIGIEKKTSDLFSMKESYDDYHYNEMIYHFHKTAHDLGRADICVTTHNEVATRLSADGIPNIKSERTYDTIRISIRNLQMKYWDMQHNQKNIAVLGIQTHVENEYNTIANNEYQYISDRLHVMDQVYLTAQTLQAAVVEGLHDAIYLFTTREILERETKNFTNFRITEQLYHKIFIRLSMGIGFGSTMSEAKQNAILGMERSRKYAVPSVFLVYDKNTLIGPIEFKGYKEEKQLPIDRNLESISEVTNVSINQLTKIKAAMTKYSKNTFTSQELASICGVSSRTMNRIIERLLDHKYAVISGKTVRNEAGRPRRVLHFYI